MRRSQREPTPADLVVGAEKNGEMWIPWVYDGRRVMTLNPVASRDRALAMARDHKERLLHPALPKKIWRKSP